MNKLLSRLRRWMAIISMATLLLNQGTGQDGGSDGESGLAQPEITSILLVDGEVVVQVSVPPGIHKVTLESRTRFGRGTWTPRAVERLDGAGGEIVFALPENEYAEMLRVRAVDSEVLPASFYEGQTEFGGRAYQSEADGSAPPGAVGGDAAYRNLEGAVDAEVGGLGADAGGGAVSRDVVESDIWAIRGERLYFFNQLKGLQIIDLTKNGEEALLSTYDLPASGEQMYVLGTNHVILLSQSNCNWGQDAVSDVVVLDVASDVASVVGVFNVPGRIQESRLVGDSLYVASQTYDVLEEGRERIWQWGTTITSFDLSDRADPAKIDTLRYAGYGNVVSATDRLFMVKVSARWWLDPATIHFIDISNPEGRMIPLGRIAAAGHVADKFKMNVDGDVFSVVSESRMDERGGRQRRVSVVETFDISDGLNPTKLGEVEVGHGESLFATRFDGDRVYIVTFLRIDPLWIVDLSDPTNPTVTGELEIPGWSTYIQPLDDRLVTVGIDNVDGWRVAVQLFDVSNPENPTLMSKVPLGENHSWSEANSDEKALTVLPGAGLIMVPYQGWGKDGYVSAVQLIDLERDVLTPRGVIEHELRPRRSTVWEEQIITISGRELLRVDASDRDAPEVLDEVELSWPVQRLVAKDGYLIELSQTNAYGSQFNPELRVVSAVDPELSFGTVALPDSRQVIGFELKADYLYAALWNPENANFFEPIPLAEEEGADEKLSRPKMSVDLLVFDVSNLPNISLVGEESAELSEGNYGYYGADLQALWPSDDVLVWAGGGFGGLWRGGIGGIAIDADIARGDVWGPWWGSNGRERLLAFDVADPAAPKLASQVNLADEGQYWNFSDAFEVNGVVYLSHQSSEFIPDILLPGQRKPKPVITIGENGEEIIEERPYGIWMQKYFLDVVDFADPYEPVIRPTVDIPGRLRGVSHQGEVIYTVGPHWDEAFQTSGREWLDVSAYDGVEVSLITSLDLRESWLRPFVVAESGAIYMATSNAERSSSALETWRLDENGRLGRVTTQSLSLSSWELRIVDAQTLVVRQDQGFGVYDVSEAFEPKALGTTEQMGCLWLDMNRVVAGEGARLWAPVYDYGAILLLEGE